MIRGIPASLLVTDRTRALLDLREGLRGYSAPEDLDFSPRMEEHLQSVLLGETYRRDWDPDCVRRQMLVIHVSATPEGASYTSKDFPALAREVIRQSFAEQGQPFPVEPPPEVVAFLEAVSDLEQEMPRKLEAALHGASAAQMLRPRLSLLNWDESVDTLTVHYLRQGGGGRLNADDAADLIGMADRTFRYRLDKLHTWGLIEAAKTSPLMLPPSSN